MVYPMPVRVNSRRPPSVRPGFPASAIPFGLPPAPAGAPPQKPAGISLCMIVKNEERFLEQCLESVRGIVDEINIVDTGSTDRTLEIARSFGARIEHRPWRNDFGWARNEALAMASRRWIFQLDADEELVAESRPLLAKIKSAPAHLTGLYVRCINESDQYKGGGQMSHAVNRIFPNDQRIRYRGAIHEFAAFDESPTGIPALMSPIRIVHHGYMSQIVNERDKFARNMEILEQAVAAEPDEPFHWYNYGVTAYLGGDDERAVKGLQRMRELTGGTQRAFTANGLQVLADVFVERLKDPETGLLYARESLAVAPDYANAHFSAAKALMLLKRYDEAREMYRAAIEDGKHASKHFVVDDEVSAWKAQCEIGTTYVLEGDDERALQCFDEALRTRPSVAPLRVNRAKALERLGRSTEAELVYRGLYDDFADENSILSYVNHLLRYQKEAQALAVIESTWEKLSKPAALSFLMAAAAVEQRCGWGSGERALQRAAMLAPGNAQVLSPLEAIYAARGDDAAIAALREAEAQCEPDAPADFLRRSHLRLKAGDCEAALHFALAGLEKAPHDGPLRYNAALALARAGKREEALMHVDAIDAADQTAYAQGRYLRAVLLCELNRLDEAFNSFESALAGTSDPSARRTMSVEIAALYLRHNRLHDAKRIAESALA